MLIEWTTFSVGGKHPLNEPLWGESYLNDVSEWRKAELRRTRSNPVKGTMMLQKAEYPAGNPASNRLAVETLRKYSLFEVQVLQEEQSHLKLDNESKKWFP